MILEREHPLTPSPSLRLASSDSPSRSAKDEDTQRIAAIASQGFTLFDLVEPCYYDHSLWQCDAVLLRDDVHRAHFADLNVDFDSAKYSIFR